VRRLRVAVEFDREVGRERADLSPCGAPGSSVRTCGRPAGPAWSPPAPRRLRARPRPEPPLAVDRMSASTAAHASSPSPAPSGKERRWRWLHVRPFGRYFHVRLS